MLLELLWNSHGFSWINVVIFLFISTIIILTIALNLFIIIAVISDKTLRNFTNIQFASMSCADLLVIILFRNIYYNYSRTIPKIVFRFKYFNLIFIFN
jgi:hypothetical protein